MCPTKGSSMANDKIYKMSFSRIYSLYIAKVEKKGRTKDEVDQVITWLTGFTGNKLKDALKNEIDLENFFKNAPALNPKRKLITGSVCGVRVEDIKESTMQNIRYLDKLIDELAKGKSMEKILRS